MAEFSIGFQTDTSGDAATKYTETQWRQMLRDIFQTDAYAGETVLAGVLNELAVSGTSSPLSVATGSAFVDGFYYGNTAPVSVVIPTPTTGTTGHRIVLRADWSGKQVRITKISSADGTAVIPAATQTDGTTWDGTLATLTITTGGVITLTDARDYCHFSKALVYRRQGGSATDWSVAGTTNYTPGATKMQAGVDTVTITSGTGTKTITFPSAFSQVPHVQLTTNNGASSTKRKCLFTVESVTTTQVVVRGYLVDGSASSTSVDVAWEATGAD